MRNMIKTHPEFSDSISEPPGTSCYFLIFFKIKYTYVKISEKVLKYLF